MSEEYLGFRDNKVGSGKKFSTILLASILILSLAATHILQVEAQPQMEISYDDGGGDDSLWKEKIMVRFSLPSGWSAARLLRAKYYLQNSYNWTVRIFVYNSDRSTELASFNYTLPTGTGWVNISLSSLDIIVNGDFYIGYETHPNATGPILYYDKNVTIDNRSYTYNITSGMWEQYQYDFMIRAVVELYIPSGEPDWSTHDEVTDLAVSADGSLIAAATGEGLKVYSGAGSLLWNWSRTNYTVTALSVSDDGNVVVAAIYNNSDGAEGESRLLFWKNAKTLSGENPPYNWSSINLYDPTFYFIIPGSLDVSSNGNQVVVVFLRHSWYKVMYWNNTLNLSGDGKDPTWGDSFSADLRVVDMSDDGDVIAMLGIVLGGDQYVYVYKNCRSRDGPQNQTYNLNYSLGTGPPEPTLALSDNGQYVVTSGYWGDYIYFFNTSMVGEWAPQWKYKLIKIINATAEFEWVKAVDISSDGNTVVAVTNIDIIQDSNKTRLPYSFVIFWDAASKTGDVSSDYNFDLIDEYTDNLYTDVSLDGAGRLAAAGTGDYLFAFNASTGEPLWLCDGTHTVAAFLRVSEDGRVVVSAGSLYYFGPETAVVVFDQVGVGSDYTGPVLKVDGVNYTVSSLPASFTWDIGSSHTFEYYEMLGVDGERYVWKETGGLSTARSGTINVPDDGGYVNATYKTQYRVTVRARPWEAQGGTFKITYTSCGTTYNNLTRRTPWGEWVDAGTAVTVCEPQRNVNQFGFQSYEPSNSLYMDEPKTITLVYIQLPVGGIIIPAKGPAGSAVQLLILGLIAATAITAAIKKTRK
jgi:hypothetical protein